MGQSPATGNELHGPWETIRYLKELGPDNLALVLEFSKWVLQTYPREGLAVPDLSPNLSVNLGLNATWCPF